LDNIGNRSLRECRRVVRPSGAYVASFGQPEHRWIGPAVQLVTMMVMKPFVSQRMTTWVTETNVDDLLVLADLLEAGTITPVIDSTYPLAETADAMCHLGAGHARGKIVVVI
jgi:NADPH:quinone reductase-like Zn-dependent oxidoreductase